MDPHKPPSRQTHWLTRPWQLSFAISGIAFLVLPLWVLMPYIQGGRSERAPDDWPSLIAVCVFFFALALLTLLGLVTGRLATSPQGLEIYGLMPKVLLPWYTLERIQVNPFGTILLVTRAPIIPGGPWHWWLKATGQDRLLPISMYVADWQNGPLVQALRTYAPQMTIPQELSRHHATPAWQHPAIILLFYLGCLVALAFAIQPFTWLLAVLPIARELAAWGWVGGLLAGAGGLLSYSASRHAQTDARAMAWEARRHYLMPFAGFVAGFAAGALATGGLRVLERFAPQIAPGIPSNTSVLLRYAGLFAGLWLATPISARAGAWLAGWWPQAR